MIETYMRLRHRLIPYLYTRNVISARFDEPLVQPMYWSFPDRAEAYSVPNQYFFGFELIVAPITSPRSSKTGLGRVKAWLPPLHRHIDIFTGTVYDGDRSLILYRTLADYPVFAHEGSIVPLDAAATPENGGVNPAAFEILVVVGRNGECTVLEDPADDSEDAKKAAPDTNERGSLIQYNQKEGKLRASVTGRKWTFRFLALTTTPQDLKVLVNGEHTKDAKVSFSKYPEAPGMLVDVPELAGEKYAITIELGSDPQLSLIDHKPRIKDILLDYQTEFHIKDQLWNIVVDSKAPISSKISGLFALGLEEELVGPIMELMLADSRGMHL